MRKLTLILSLCFAFLAIAQDITCPIDTVNGQVVYRYQVQKSEGLYRISKTFNVSQNDILRLNPTLETQGLKLGQTILIPVVERIDSAHYVCHTLQPKETLYGLSRQYGVTVAEIQRLNPETSVRMQIGSVLLIKKKEEAEKPVVKPALEIKQTPIERPVEKPMEQHAEHIDQVAARHEQMVGTDAFKPFAEQLAKAADTVSQSDNQSLREVQSRENTSQEALTPIISELPIRLAYMLPFMTNAQKRDASIDRFIDFYEGSLLAIYEAQEQGQRFDIYTYDIEKDAISVQQTLQRGELQNVDAIVGPAYPAQVNYTAMFAKQNRTPVLIPFTPKVSGIEYNPYLLQFNPSAEQEAQFVIESMLPRKDSVRFILIQSNAAEKAEYAVAIRNAAAKHEFDMQQISISAIMSDSLGSVLDADKENILVFPSSKWSAAQIIMPKITAHTLGKDVRIYGPYAWSEENTTLPLLYVTLFHPVDEEKAVRYEQLYAHYFGHKHASQHPRFDMLGYDLTKSLILILQNAQTATNEAERDAIYSTVQQGLQTNVCFQRVSQESGMINTAMQIIEK